MDKCDSCGHSWHGLPCTWEVSDAGWPADVTHVILCGCSTSLKAVPNAT